MLAEDNEYMCRISPGTPMGNLLRRYWLPTLLSKEVAGPDSPPVRVRVLGEDLVAFRDTNGDVGLLVENCAHRGASLFFGRNEECGLRCVYHGWKYDVHGNCIDMPNEPAESNFKEKIRLTAYPTVESGGMVWAYMGPADKMLPFRKFKGHFVPNEEAMASKTFIWCNYIQSLEGNIDSSHISFLHRSFRDFQPFDDGTDRPGYPSVKMSTYIRSFSREARLEVQDTDYGFRYAALRDTPAGHLHVRMTVFVLPVLTYVANSITSNNLSSGSLYVPRDDDTCWKFRYGRDEDSLHLDEKGNRVRTPENDYLIDRAAQRTVSYSGILGNSNQDYAVTESMGPIYDRSNEHLGTTDLAIIRMRQQLIQAARNLEQGIEPPGLDPEFAWHRIRSEEKILPAGGDWQTLATEADETYRELVASWSP